MRTLNFHILLFVFFAISFTACNDDLPEIKKDYIVAGDIIQNQLITFNDSIIPGWQQYLILPIKINQDTIIDFKFYARHIAYYGGMNDIFSSRLEIFNHMEILVDTSLYSNYVERKNVITPKILDKYDTINREGIWLTDTIVDLSYSIELLDFGNSDAQMEVSIFNGWNDLGRKYMGYRILNDKDTIYGWIELKIEHFNRVYLYQTAHR